MENYVKVGGELEPGDWACFQTVIRGKRNKKETVEITGVWDGEKFTSYDKYDTTTETIVRKREWLIKIEKG